MNIAKILMAVLCWACAWAQQKEGMACNLKAIGGAERSRYNELSRRLRTAAERQRELADGYGWQLDRSKLPFSEAAEWVSFERRCCPFLTLQLETSGDKDDYWLNLRGPEGVKSFLAAEFDIRPRK